MHLIIFILLYNYLTFIQLLFDIYTIVISL